MLQAPVRIECFHNLRAHLQAPTYFHSHSDDRSRLTTCDDSPTTRYRRYKQTLQEKGDSIRSGGRQEEEEGDILNVASSLPTRKRGSHNRRLSSPPSLARQVADCSTSSMRRRPSGPSGQGEVSRESQSPLQSHLDRRNRGSDQGDVPSA